jgi:hypothetical protein
MTTGTGKRKLEYKKKTLDAVDDINLEEYTDYDNIKNPFNFRSWWNTLIAASDAPYSIRTKIYEKAVSYLPGSYKLWYHYLKEARDNIKRYPVQDKRFEVINELHERALIFMNKVIISC